MNLFFRRPDQSWLAYYSILPITNSYLQSWIVKRCGNLIFIQTKMVSLTTTIQKWIQRYSMVLLRPLIDCIQPYRYGWFRNSFLIDLNDQFTEFPLFAIQGSLQLKNNKDELIGELPLSNTFNNPTLLTRPQVYDGLINGKIDFFK